MKGQTQLRRRGRDRGLCAPLVERAREMTAIEHSLAEARDGSGNVLLLEAPAGHGKSRLLTFAGDLARDAGMQVLGAHGSELEREFPFGVAIQLFEPRLSAADVQERGALLTGPARHAAGLLFGEPDVPGYGPEEQIYLTIHALFSLCQNLLKPADGADRVPLAILVDDDHWADRPSLRFQAYLADRIEGLPIAMIVAVRSGETVAERQALAAVRQAAGGQIFRPGALSPEGVARLVRSVMPDADDAFCQACARASSGNLFLLTELIEQVVRDRAAPDAVTGARLTELAPESVLHAIVPRLESLPDEAQLVAHVVAVLESGTSLGLVSEMSGLDTDKVARAADDLAAVHLFSPGSPLGFVHPLIATTVRNSISPLLRGQLHRRAASLLARAGAPEEQIAMHLLLAPPEDDRLAVEVLRTAARHAMATGAVGSAVRMLERAVAEQPDAATDPELIADLAEAAAKAGAPAGMVHVDYALRVTDDVGLRARLSLARARGLYSEGAFRQASEILADALRGCPDRGLLTEQLQAAYIASAFFVPDLAADAEAHAQRLLARIADTPSVARLDALAHMTIHGGLRGATRAAVIEVGQAAWSDGALLEAESLDGLSWPLLSGALLYAGELPFCLEVCDAATQAARRDGSPAALAAASYCRAWPLYELGRIGEAAADAQHGLDAQPDGWHMYLRPAYSAVALCHIERGSLEHAETALSIIDVPDVRERIHVPSLLEARAQLRLAQHRPDEALDDAMRAGTELENTLQVGHPGAVAWRSTAALAHLALGDLSSAQALAAEELERALTLDVPRLIVRNLRILGLAERGAAGLELLREAVTRGQGSGTLELVKALVDYGGALRRGNRRSAAREPLRLALDAAHRGGATVLAQRARFELAAAGGRVRRAVLSGPESLTPSERRVAEIAAQGLTTRQMAEALFVTTKTVEFHLGNVYRKLGINSRADLAAILDDRR